MSKKDRTIIKVDEDKVKRMIAGEEPYMQENSKDKSGLEEIQAVQPSAPLAVEDSFREKTATSSVKKRPVRSSYADIFLKTDRSGDKRQTSVQLSETVFRKMEVLLKATKGLSTGLFINNVLMHHFEEYEEDIQVVREKYIAKLSEDV